MPPIELGPTRPVGATDARTVRSSGGQVQQGGQSTTAPAALVRSEALDPGEAPVDAERVTAIRKAVEQGNYPLVPAKIADAIIAAGLLLRVNT